MQLSKYNPSPGPTLGSIIGLNANFNPNSILNSNLCVQPNIVQFKLMLFLYINLLNLISDHKLKILKSK